MHVFPRQTLLAANHWPPEFSNNWFALLSFIPPYMHHRNTSFLRNRTASSFPTELQFTTSKLQDKNLKQWGFFLLRYPHLFLGRKSLESNGESTQHAVSPLWGKYVSFFTTLQAGWRNFLSLKCLVTFSTQVKKEVQVQRKLLWDVTVVTGIQTLFLEGKIQK